MYPNTMGEKIIAAAELPDVCDGPAVWLTETGRLVPRSDDPAIAAWIAEFGVAFREHWMNQENPHG